MTEHAPTLPIQKHEVTSDALHEAWYRRTFPPVERVRDGIWSIPIPFQNNPMRYTLCYLLIGDGETVVVDPGWDSSEGFDAFLAGLDEAGVVPSEVTGVLITHVHPDHHGLTHFVARLAPNAWIGMSADEAASLERHRGGVGQGAMETFRTQLAAAGVPTTGALERIGSDNGLFERMPLATLLFGDGDLIPLRGRTVRAVLTPGHTPGHLCFVDEEDDVILTGDHVLPRISPNVGLHAHSTVSPVRAYLGSLARLEHVDLEVLPAHQWRFRGLPDRVAELQEHHRERLDEVLGHLGNGPLTAWELAHGLTWAHGWDTLGPIQQWSAVAETIAHVRYLVEDGVVVTTGDSPVRYEVRPST
ncbi:MBL fold metallo-hydrolase [Planctomonas sp. JC2975]|uniref:MBL fold metallo-hydrolase n=1 Tax=Planctomonas sp. JC2975 TaxID=2729626 RepID=UPI0014743F73|nr:MBL fold metallo-hydrolase [Planctomonas sp. JC2975]NNC13830.1 MBL fold metallo-hydrolase [Planctomonas sp. JC2975]